MAIEWELKGKVKSLYKPNFFIKQLPPLKTLGAIMISVVNLLIFLFQRFFQWIFAKLESSASDEVKILLLTALYKVVFFLHFIGFQSLLSGFYYALCFYYVSTYFGHLIKYLVQWPTFTPFSLSDSKECFLYENYIFFVVLLHICDQ